MASYKKYQSKSGIRWLVQISLGKDPITGKYKSTTRRGFKTKKEAEAAARAILTQHSRGTFITENKITFEEVYNEWMLSEERRLKPSTMHSKAMKFKKHILPYFSKLYIQKISAEYCQDFIDQLSSKINSFKEYGNQLDLLFRYAIKKKIIVKNPMNDVIYPNIPDEQQFPDKELNVLHWEKDTVRYFLKKCEEELTFREYALFRTLLFTGIRKGELGALLESDINTEKMSITINKTLFWESQKYSLLTPKTPNSRRVIFLDQKTFEVLLHLKELNQELRNDFGNPEIEHFVFPSVSDLKPMRHSYPNTLLESACKKFEVDNIKVHGPRHTHASMLYAAGARMKDIQRRLGHAKLATTMDTYTHLTEKSDKHLNHLLIEYLKSTNNGPQKIR
ncbi:MAG TPA: site-specific integrase [Bacillus bacterium]|uniref:Site-specific integrase n=1 Tax=Siminovitchia fordii TaxID=254759 RepID=A0ABQ4KAN1_9BACI|nr:site-specific integrase [Siminovitchia fordii]GIN22789.1 site-specific integrase [Siminovitchia fordii]HBZ11331.1 site-specific integrase [Bacillus sp. (in: firmicutes)]